MIRTNRSQLGYRKRSANLRGANSNYTLSNSRMGHCFRQYFTPAIHDGQVVRLIYQGQLLRDDSRSLASYGLHDNCIVHCHISTTPYSQQSSSSNSGGNAVGQRRSTNGPIIVEHRFETNNDEGIGGGFGFNIGDHLEAIFAVKFVLLWSAFVFYPHYFDLISFISLTMCTFVFLMFAYSSRQRTAATVAANAAAVGGGGDVPGIIGADIVPPSAD